MTPAHHCDRHATTRDVKEALVDSLAGGATAYAVSLFVDNAPAGTVYLEQRAPAAAAIEGARVTFDIGPSLSPSALYYVEVKPIAATGPTVSYTLRSIGPASAPKWEGITGASGENPALALAPGSTLRVTARNGDDGFHNIGLRDADGDSVDPPGWSDDITATGAEVTLAWSPTAAGTYSYACQYHPSMSGTLTVSA